MNDIDSMASATPDPDQSLNVIPWGPGSQQARITIHHDGRVELADGITLDEASREFWTAVQEMGLSQAAFWETAATRNGELYSGAESQRDDLREAIARVRSIPTTPQSMDANNPWSADYLTGYRNALQIVQRAIDQPPTQAAEAPHG